MFFEDEKDIIKDGTEIYIDEDGTVTWEDVLEDDSDIPSLNDGSLNNAAAPEMTDLGDELQLVQEEEVNEQELLEMLNDAQKSSLGMETTQSNTTSDTQSDDDFDLDSQLASVVLEQNNEKSSDDVELTPRKNEKKSTSSSMPLLMAILFGVLVAGGIYYGKTFFAENEMFANVAQNNLEPRQTVQQEMNNITPEELAQRQEQENIPVVNEEEAQDVEVAKEEEEKPEEKKQVVNVIPTGRANPFMPTSKYMSTPIPEANIEFDKAGIPKPPDGLIDRTEDTIKLMSIAVSGIMYDEVKPSAIITYDGNDYFVQKGDRLDKYKIVDIARNFVTIALGSNIYKANIGEEFKIGYKFYGSADYLPTQQGGGRQYYTITKEQDEIKDSNELRYVSEDDITINAK